MIHDGVVYQHVDLLGLLGDDLPRDPYVLRILAENVARVADEPVRSRSLTALREWLGTKHSDAEIPFMPNRLLMHDTTSTPALYLGAAEAGLGLAYCHEGEVFDALASGRLVSVLDDWSPSFAGFNLFYPGRHQLGQGLRALIDMLKEYHRIR